MWNIFSFLIIYLLTILDKNVDNQTTRTRSKERTEKKSIYFYYSKYDMDEEGDDVEGSGYRKVNLGRPKNSNYVY